MDYTKLSASRVAGAVVMGGRKSYMSKVVATSPLVYYPLNETAGATAVNYGTLGAAGNGSYVGVDLANAAGPDGKPVPLFDGASDYVNAFTAGLVAAFSPDAGSIMNWVKVSAAGVWTDNIGRNGWNLYSDSTNRISIRRSTVNSRLLGAYLAANTANSRDINTADMGWLSLVLTWDKTADQVIAYLNGAQVGAAMNGMAVWSGGALTRVLIGAFSVTPTLVWSGWLAHAAFWTTPLSPAQVSTLAKV